MGGKTAKLIISILICQVAGALGYFFATGNIKNWYQFLEKPIFNPPDWIFALTWIALYTIMGISVFLIWKREQKDICAHSALKLFWIHLFFNVVWSIIFFGLHSPGGALVDIIILWILILILLVKFFRINQWASYLLVPYFFWISFVTLLNFSIWYLN